MLLFGQNILVSHCNLPFTSYLKVNIGTTSMELML